MGNKQTKTQFQNGQSSNKKTNVTSNQNEDLFFQQQCSQNAQNISSEEVENYRHQHQASEKIKRLHAKPDDANKQTVAVIVTFSQSGTYDSLFSSIEQKAEEGTKVLVYQCSSYAFKEINDAFDQKFDNDTFKELITQINKVDPDCVVFNWECCGHYSSENFQEGEKEIFKFIKRMIDRKFLCMFSDFSLKSLINRWNQSALGPNPFKKVGQTSTTVELRFKANQLKECPSAQLQTVGQMAEQGKVNVHTMGGTIMYGVNKKNLKHDKYTLKVLTVPSNLKVSDDNLVCKIDDYQGAAGHVLVKYPSGGAILTSMTHWIELMKVDTSEQKLFEVAAREYGQSYAREQKMQYDKLGELEKVNWRSEKTVEFIQNQAPCMNMKKKSRW